MHMPQESGHSENRMSGYPDIRISGYNLKTNLELPDPVTRNPHDDHGLLCTGKCPDSLIPNDLNKNEEMGFGLPAPPRMNKTS